MKIYADHPNEKHIRQIVDSLENDAVIIYPTDTLYALGCSLKSPKAIARIKQIKGKLLSHLTIICPNLGNIADYAKVDNRVFKLLKRNTPGEFTFILNASNRIPDKFLEDKKTVGIRVPSNPIPVMITRMLGSPLVSTSVPPKGLDAEDTGNPELLQETYAHLVDWVIDGGEMSLTPSTVVDCTGDEITIVRQSEAELVWV